MAAAVYFTSVVASTAPCLNYRILSGRINSLAKDLGIERPYLRSQRSITNSNTLIYVLLNLRALGRIRAHYARRAAEVARASLS